MPFLSLDTATAHFNSSPSIAKEKDKAIPVTGRGGP
jgi:hypothetical protein